LVAMVAVAVAVQTDADAVDPPPPSAAASSAQVVNLLESPQNWAQSQHPPPPRVHFEPGGTIRLEGAQTPETPVRIRYARELPFLAGSILTFAVTISKAGPNSEIGLQLDGIRDAENRTVAVRFFPRIPAVQVGNRRRVFAYVAEDAGLDRQFDVAFDNNALTVIWSGEKLLDLPVRCPSGHIRPSLFARGANVRVNRLGLALTSGAVAPGAGSVCRIDAGLRTMRRLPDPWPFYFGVHYSRAAPDHPPAAWKTVRGYGGPHVALPPKENRSVPARPGPFTGRNVYFSLADFRRYSRWGNGPSMSVLVPELIHCRLTGICPLPAVRLSGTARAPQSLDKDVLYWALRDVHEKFPPARRWLRWQWGNEVNGIGGFDPFHWKARLARTGGSPWPYFNRKETADAYAEQVLAPAIEVVRRVAQDVYGEPTAVPVVAGSVANSYNPASRAWLRRVLFHRIRGDAAPSLAGEPIWKYVDVITVHYPFARDAGADVMQELWREYVDSGKVRAVWITEEHGRRGRGPVTVVRRGMAFIDWVARHALSAQQVRLCWWGIDREKVGGRARDAVQRIGEFLGDRPLFERSRDVPGGRLYVLAATAGDGRVQRLLAALTHTKKAGAPPQRLDLAMSAEELAGRAVSVTQFVYSETHPPRKNAGPQFRLENGVLHLELAPSPLQGAVLILAEFGAASASSNR